VKSYPTDTLTRIFNRHYKDMIFYKLRAGAQSIEMRAGYWVLGLYLGLDIK
jgi:hypothetical protein